MASDSDLNLKLIIDILKREDSRCSLSWQKVKLCDIEAREFLSFAKEDLEEDSEKGRINALSNAKRAIECRIDELLTLFNFRSFSSLHGWKLPYKMQILQTFGLTTPSILKRQITSKRNLLEHEYVRPNQQEIQDIVEIAQLFLKASDAHVEAGYIASATIDFGSDFDTIWEKRQKEGVQRDSDLTGTRRGHWIHWVVPSEEYKLAFDLENEAITLTHLLYDQYYASNLRSGEIQTQERRRGQERANTVAIRDCEMEDVRELMILLREKAK